MIYKRIIIIFIIIIVLIQFKQINTTNPETDITKGYLSMSNAPKEIGDLIKTACFDCHSNEVTYPWYSHVAPVSWFIGNHIQEGRKHLNFSEWENYPEARRIRKLEECVDELKADKMPLSSYTLLHASAKLTDENKTALIKWFSSNIEAGKEPK